MRFDPRLYVHVPCGLETPAAASSLVASHPEERRRHGLLLKHLQPAWVKLIRSGAMQPILIEDTGGRAPEIAGCGASVFVSDQFLERLKALLRRSLSEDGSILPLKATREANSRQGLSCVGSMCTRNGRLPNGAQALHPGCCKTEMKQGICGLLLLG